MLLNRVINATDLKIVAQTKITKSQLSKSVIKRACDTLRRDDGVGVGNYVEQLSWLLFLRVFENFEKELREITIDNFLT
ncbi:MAG: hypothetical protein GTN99_00960 [Candidatus Dadabacteria bacterium]|nr:hypothetical protein [Candidatus Dadabacteria bacterium]